MPVEQPAQLEIQRLVEPGRAPVLITVATPAITTGPATVRHRLVVVGTHVGYLSTVQVIELGTYLRPETEVARTKVPQADLCEADLSLLPISADHVE